MRFNISMLFMFCLLFFSCFRQGETKNIPQKYMEPRISIKKDCIEIRNSIDLFAYNNYEIIVNDIYNAKLNARPEIKTGQILTVPYKQFELPAGTVIKSVAFKIPGYIDYIINQEFGPFGNLSGFLGIEWGSNIQSARLILQQRGFTQISVNDRTKPLSNAFDSEKYENQKYIYARGDFAGYEDATIYLEFYKDYFYQASINFSRADLYKDWFIESIYNSFSERYWKAILSSNIIGKPMYTWIFDDNNYINLIDLSSNNFVQIEIEYTEKNTYDEKTKNQNEINNRLIQEMLEEKRRQVFNDM